MATFVRVQNIEHDLGTEGRFGLRVTDPDVQLRAVPGTVARIRIEYELRALNDEDADEAFEAVKYRVTQGEGSLEVAEPSRANSTLGSLGRLLGLSGVRVEATVSGELPAGTHLSYTGVSGDLTATGFSGSQEYRTVSGDLVLSELAGPIRINGVSSDVSVRASGQIALQANTVSGDLSVVAPRISESRIVTVSGDVELEGELGRSSPHRVETVSGDLLLGLTDGLTLEVRGLSSEVSVSLPHRTEGTRERRRYVIGGGEANLHFSSMSGDVLARQSRRVPASRAPQPPTPPTPPAPPTPPVSPDEQLEILKALERGEIDVDEATRRLAGGDDA